MAGVEHAARGRILEEHVAAMLQAWTGEPFEYEGRTVQVTPKPVTEPHPMVFVGGGVPAAARRAARLRLPLMPMNADAAVRDAYYDEAKKIGFDRGFVVVPEGPTFVHVADDPDKAWAEIGPYVLYEAQTYASFQTPGQHSLPGVDAETSTTSSGRRSTSSARPTRCSRACKQVPRHGRDHVQPARRRHAPGARRGRASSCSRRRCCPS